MKPLLLLALALPANALAATPELPASGAVEAAGQSQAQLLDSAQRCVKASLKNDQFTLTSNTGMGLLTGAASYKPAPPISTPDPTSVVDADLGQGRIEGRHTFATAGFASEGIVRADLRIEAKEGKFRLTWHDAVYSAPIAPRWKEDLKPLIPAALPYKKAIQTLQATMDTISKCIATPPPADTW